MYRAGHLQNLTWACTHRHSDGGCLNKGSLAAAVKGYDAFISYLGAFHSRFYLD